MDSSIATDPRFKLLGRALGVSWREAIGSCFLLWLACYERRSKCFRKVEADIAAELEGFADALLKVGLASPGGAADEVIVHGVEKRIEFLASQSKKGAIGGKKSGKSRASRSNQTLPHREASSRRSCLQAQIRPVLRLSAPCNPIRFPRSLFKQNIRSRWAIWPTAPMCAT